ncbi:PoNe immunity protein domain-containing protein [Enterovibrio sp. FF113]|uniref:PoNe immunity protein domain-containing protein n=1 Tax=Enterovibrio sp. FF113 TaxID=3230010 RepID=UPI00352D6AA4
MTGQALTFNQMRRDAFLDEHVYDEQNTYFSKDNSRRYTHLTDENKDIFHRSSISWSLFLNKVEHALLEYSGGANIEAVQLLVDVAFQDLNRHKDQFTFEIIKYWEPDGYQFLLWLVSLAVLTGNKDALLTIARMTGKNPQGGDDKCIVQLYTRVGLQGLPRQDSLVFEKPYSDFYDAIKGDGVSPTKSERQAALNAYLKGWYKGMKNCYWHNRHKGRHATHFGYWSLESGAATILFDLDDSEYRKSLYYPKDWVDFAREQNFGALFSHEKLPFHHIALPGDEAPVTAEWVSNVSNEALKANMGERLSGDPVNKAGDAAIWISI